MTTKADYTNEEWDLLCAGPLVAGVGVSLLDSGLISRLKEDAAIHRALHEAKTKYADNELVVNVVAAFEARGDEAHKAPAGATMETVLAQLVQLDAILDKKAKENDAQAEEAIIYRNFLYEVADRAAHAAGGFLGLSNKVSDEEAYYLKKVKEILFREPT